MVYRRVGIGNLIWYNVSMPTKRTYTDEDFMVAVRESRSWAEVFRKIGIKPTGGNYSLAKQRAINLGVSLSHMTGQSW